MTRTVWRKMKGRGRAPHYHITEDCRRLQDARDYRTFDLADIADDVDCCVWCIKRVFLRTSACSRCDADAHDLDLATLDGEGPVQWPCPAEAGFTYRTPADIFDEKLDRAGLTTDDLREAAERLDTSGPRGPQLSARLEEMDPDELVTDGGQVQTDEDKDLVEIEFTDWNINPVLDGEKTVTYRVGFEHDLDPMQEVSLVDEDGEEFSRAFVATKLTRPLAAMATLDPPGHRTYETLCDVRDDLARYYPEEELDGWTDVHIIAFTIKHPHDGIVTDGGQDNSHASGIAAQLRAAEEDEELPDDLRESARERREEIEAEEEAVDGE